MSAWWSDRLASDGLFKKQKKKEEERDLPNIEGSHTRMEWERKKIKGNKERKRFYREFKKKREDKLVF